MSTMATPGPLKRPYAPHLPPQERREQLLDTALAIIAELGVKGVTVQRVARTADVSPPVVYKQFKDANHILRALLDRETQRALQQLAPMLPAIQNAKDPVEVTVHAARAYLEAIAEEPVRWRTILTPVGDNPPPVRRRLEKAREALRAQLEPLFAWGLQLRGVKGVDPEVLARLAVTLFEETGRLVLTEPDAYPPERLVGFFEAFATQFFAGTTDQPQASA